MLSLLHVQSLRHTLLCLVTLPLAALDHPYLCLARLQELHALRLALYPAQLVGFQLHPERLDIYLAVRDLLLKLISPHNRRQSPPVV